MLSLWVALIMLSAPSSGDSGPKAVAVEEIELTVEVSGDIRLAGTLFAPEGQERLATLVFGHGSGKEHRKLEGLRGLARELAREGFAALLWDKRGVGDSGGVYEETPDFETAAADLASWARRAGRLPQVAPSRIALVGHSQAGWIVPKAATVASEVAAVVVLCGGGVTVRDQVNYMRGRELLEGGMPRRELTEFEQFSRRLFDYLGTGDDYEQLRDDYAGARSRPWFALYREQGFGENLPPPGRLDHPVFEFFRRAPVRSGVRPAQAPGPSPGDPRRARLSCAHRSCRGVPAPRARGGRQPSLHDPRATP